MVKQDGLEDQRNTSIYECIKCKDKEGFIVRLEDRSEVWRWCGCHEQKIMKKRMDRIMKSSRITDEFKKLSFDNFTLHSRPTAVHDAYHCARAYIEDFNEIRKERNNSIALLGRPGAGKTHLLISIANQLLNQGVGVIYFPWVEGINDLKSDFDKLEEKVHQLKTVPVLFIDDLFKGRKMVTDWQLEQIFEIVNYRYLNHLPLLISSEKDMDQLCDVDEGTGTRIYEMCAAYTVLLKGDRELNYRLTGEVV